MTHESIIEGAGASYTGTETFLYDAFVKGTEHNQFHALMEQFFNQYRTGGPKATQPITNKEYLQALRTALEAVKDNLTGAAKFTKKEIDALVEFAEKGAERLWLF